MRSRCVRFCWLPTISCCRCCKAPVGVCWHQRRLRLETTWTISAGKVCRGGCCPLERSGWSWEVAATPVVAEPWRSVTCRVGAWCWKGSNLVNSFHRQSLPVVDTLVNPDTPCLVRSSVANGFIPSSPGRGAVLTDCWWIVLSCRKGHLCPEFERQLSRSFSKVAG